MGSVNIKYDGVPLKGTPIILKKRVPTYTLDSENNKITFKNVKNHKNIKVNPPQKWNTSSTATLQPQQLTISSTKTPATTRTNFTSHTATKAEQRATRNRQSREIEARNTSL